MSENNLIQGEDSSAGTTLTTAAPGRTLLPVSINTDASSALTIEEADKIYWALQPQEPIKYHNSTKPLPAWTTAPISYTSGNETILRGRWLATDGRTELQQCDGMRRMKDGRSEWEGYVDVEEWRGLGTGQSEIHRSYYVIGPDGIGFETSKTGKRMIGLSEAEIAKASVGPAFSVIPIGLPEPRRYYTGETLPDTCDYWRKVERNDQVDERTGSAFESTGGPSVDYECVTRMNGESRETVAIVSVGWGMVVEIPAHVGEQVNTDHEVVENTTGFWRKRR